MFILVPITLFGWFFVVLFLYRYLPPQRAVVISFITAYLFLPVYDYVIPGLPGYGKMSATCYATVVAVLCYDVEPFKRFRPSLIDLPMLCFCSAPFVSSISNGLGVYDGFREASERIAVWAVPYILGRVYLNSLTGLRQLAIGIFTGGLVYLPLCLYEFKMSPILHAQVYGMPPTSYAWAQSIRKGGYRPVVFTIHGLSVALWMMAATLIGIWLWRSGTLHRFWNFSMKLLVPSLIFTMVLIQSTGAFLYLLVSTAALFTARWLRTSIVVLILVVSTSSYLYVATTGNFNGDQIVTIFSQAVNPDRAQSLEYRFDQEKALIAKARQRTLFGWAGWGRSRIFNEWGEDTSVTDSWWVIMFGTGGFYSLISGTLVYLLPVTLFTYYYPAKLWSHPKIAPAAAISLVTLSYMVDNLVNASVMPVFYLGIGGLSGLIAKELEPENLGRTGVSLAVADSFLIEQIHNQSYYLSDPAEAPPIKSNNRDEDF